jgi:hypothetical protein
MKPFRWDETKDKLLRATRGVSFVDVLASYYAGGILDDIEHPNQERYPNQHILIIKIRDYAYLVPYSDATDATIWKTVIPSRKMTRKYLGRKSHDQG